MGRLGVEVEERRVTTSEHETAPSRRQRVAQEEAARRLVDATIDLMREVPMAKVTTRRVADRAGLSLLAISRSFGDQQGLFVEAARELARRYARHLDSSGRPADMFHPDAVLHTRVLAWLLQNGADPLTLVPDPEAPILQRLAVRQQLLGPVSDRTAAAMHALAIFAAEGIHLFSPTRNMTENELLDVAMLIEIGRAHV